VRVLWSPIAERLVGPDVVIGVAEEVDFDGEGVAVVDAGAARNGLVHADIDGACCGVEEQPQASGLQLGMLQCASLRQSGTSPETWYGMPQMEKLGYRSATTTLASTDGSSSRARSAAAMPASKPPTATTCTVRFRPGPGRRARRAGAAPVVRARRGSAVPHRGPSLPGRPGPSPRTACPGRSDTRHRSPS